MIDFCRAQIWKLEHKFSSYWSTEKATFILLQINSYNTSVTVGQNIIVSRNAQICFLNFLFQSKKTLCRFHSKGTRSLNNAEILFSTRTLNNAEILSGTRSLNNAEILFISVHISQTFPHPKKIQQHKGRKKLVPLHFIK